MFRISSSRMRQVESLKTPTYSRRLICNSKHLTHTQAAYTGFTAAIVFSAFFNVRILTYAPVDHVMVSRRRRQIYSKYKKTSCKCVSTTSTC